MAIVAATVACFWVYGLIVHGKAAYGPLSVRAYALEHRSDDRGMPVALAPDMNSDAVRHANADVPTELRSEHKPNPNPEQKSEPNKAKHTAAPHRKKKATAMARRPVKAWTKAYAWGARTFQGPFRGY